MRGLTWRLKRRGLLRRALLKECLGENQRETVLSAEKRVVGCGESCEMRSQGNDLKSSVMLSYYTSSTSTSQVGSGRLRLAVCLGQRAESLLLAAL